MDLEFKGPHSPFFGDPPSSQHETLSLPTTPCRVVSGATAAGGDGFAPACSGFSSGSFRAPMAGQGHSSLKEERRGTHAFTVPETDAHLIRRKKLSLSWARQKYTLPFRGKTKQHFKIQTYFPTQLLKIKNRIIFPEDYRVWDHVSVFYPDYFTS